jgi:hypothetical protein
LKARTERSRPEIPIRQGQRLHKNSATGAAGATGVRAALFGGENGDNRRKVNIMSLQRYVSPDLTHFVGRGVRNQREQYALLKAILLERRLRARLPEPPGRAAYALEMHPAAPLSGNRAFRGSYVCFCDIPPGDLDVHMRKYSRFGLAFPKDFLLERGASPVMYVPGRGRPALLPFHPYPRRRVSSNNVAFDEFWSRYQRFRSRMEDAAHDVPDEVNRLFHDVKEFLDIYLLSHLKFFDPYLPDEHKENYYMEREWRVMREVKFRHREIRRVILPEGYAVRFRRDFPKYDGEVVFAD